MISARVVLSLLSEGYFLGDFRKTYLGPPFALFQEMRVLGDLAKIAITSPFGLFWSRLRRHNILQSLHLKSILVGG